MKFRMLIPAISIAYKPFQYYMNVLRKSKLLKQVETVDNNKITCNIDLPSNK
jgi:hypothetical protein